ncbi:MAG: serine/threonine protein kinase, partial [Caldithrix sp.]
MIGQQISHYEILEKLGSGGMGSVYKAKDLKLDRLVAIKFLNKDLLTDKESRQRFINEAKTVSSLDHPNIAVVHEIDEFEDSIFICMGFYEGETLLDLISEGPLPLADVYSFAIQIARGLAEAHKAGVVHRDIKPANIMVTKNGQVKILDFGLSKGINMTELTRQDTILGTAAYMSPEQVQGKPLDHLTDIFSFGIMLYEMTTGDRPFAGEYGAAVSYAIMHENPLPIRNQRPEIPHALEDVVLKALAKEEPERYQSATEIETDFKAIQDGDSVKTSLRPKIAISSARKRTWALAGSILMLGLIFSLFMVFRSGPPTPGTDNSIMVLPFTFEGSEESWNWLGSAITELINTNLAQYNSLRVSGSRQGAAIMRNLGIENLTNLSKDDLKKIARAAKVTSIVTGSLIKMGNKISTRATVLQIDEEELLRETKRLEGEPKKLNELAAIISSQLVTLLKIEINANNRPAEPTQSLEAFRFFL